MCMLIASETPVARKPHSCTWCGQLIEVGAKYVRERIVGDDGPCTNKLHPECSAALVDAAHEERGCIYFDPGSQPRGGMDPNTAGPVQ